MTSASIRVLAEAAAEQDRNTEAWRLVFETPVSLASRVRAAATCKRMYQMLQLRPTNGVRWAIRVFENYAASDELTMIT